MAGDSSQIIDSWKAGTKPATRRTRKAVTFATLSKTRLKQLEQYRDYDFIELYRSPRTGTLFAYLKNTISVIVNSPFGRHNRALRNEIFRTEKDLRYAVQDLLEPSMRANLNWAEDCTEFLLNVLHEFEEERKQPLYAERLAKLSEDDLVLKLINGPSDHGEDDGLSVAAILRTLKEKPDKPAYYDMLKQYSAGYYYESWFYRHPYGGEVRDPIYRALLIANMAKFVSNADMRERQNITSKFWQLIEMLPQKKRVGFVRLACGWFTSNPNKMVMEHFWAGLRPKHIEAHNAASQVMRETLTSGHYVEKLQLLRAIPELFTNLYYFRDADYQKKSWMNSYDGSIMYNEDDLLAINNISQLIEGTGPADRRMVFINLPRELSQDPKQHHDVQAQATKAYTEIETWIQQRLVAHRDLRAAAMRFLRKETDDTMHVLRLLDQLKPR